jgi:hypothetical protein
VISRDDQSLNARSAIAAALALLWLALAAPAAAQVSFSDETDYPTGASPTSVAVGDFTADSHLDLAVANYRSGNVSVLLAGPGGNFSFPTNFPAGANPSSVAVGDFNVDSHPDLAVANSGSGNV